MSKFNVGDRVYHKEQGLGVVEKHGLFLDSAFVRFDGLLYHVIDANLTLAEPLPSPKEDRFVVIFNGKSYPIAPGDFDGAAEAAKEISSDNPGAVVEVYKRVTGFTSEMAFREVP